MNPPTTMHPSWSSLGITCSKITRILFQSPWLRDVGHVLWQRRHKQRTRVVSVHAWLHITRKQILWRWHHPLRLSLVATLASEQESRRGITCYLIAVAGVIVSIITCGERLLGLVIRPEDMLSSVLHQHDRWNGRIARLLVWMVQELQDDHLIPVWQRPRKRRATPPEIGERPRKRARRSAPCSPPPKTRST